MKELYQNPNFSGAFTGRRAFYRSLKDEGKEVTHKKVKKDTLKVMMRIRYINL